MIHFFLGAPRRDEGLLAYLSRQGARSTGINTRWCYFVSLTGIHPLSELEYLLGAQHSRLHLDARSMLVTTRPGTVSAWSSKATQLAHAAGLDRVGRIEYGHLYHFDGAELSPQQWLLAEEQLHDRMTQTVWRTGEEPLQLFSCQQPPPPSWIAVLEEGRAALERANRALGLALSEADMQHVQKLFERIERNPSDAELMMFSQVNSEHCRHKIFNARWQIDGSEQSETLFDMIRHTHHQSPHNTIVAYADNAAIITGGKGIRWQMCDGVYRGVETTIHTQIKAETHNHPTAISPYPGAATGAGGEIRDEAATGRGGTPKAALVGYSVSHLNIPGYIEPWEYTLPPPDNRASALQIMLEAPIGAARYNNEFGRPVLSGYFRSWLSPAHPADGAIQWRGYHKPIMIAGGLGSIAAEQCRKHPLPGHCALVVLGGSAQQIGLGGGALSSQPDSASSEHLEFASVQRGNPEMQRRCQEVINRCTWMGAENPILSIHDVGAGGLSNAFPELIHAAGIGGWIDLEKIPSDDPSMSPLAIWCNESQERYAIAIRSSQLARFTALCRRERCPIAVVGHTNDSDRLVVQNGTSTGRAVIDMALSDLLDNAPTMQRCHSRLRRNGRPLQTKGCDLSAIALQILAHPTVADKSFLITIGDRSVGGLVARDQMVGPWQVAVADCAVTLRDYSGFAGEAMALGERTPTATINAPASARMAVAEAITNLLAADIRRISDIKLSANWMAVASHSPDNADLYDAVYAVAKELCPALGIAIPVGKDSLSMQTRWRSGDTACCVAAPVSLIVSGFSPVADVRQTLTPQLRPDPDNTSLWLVDLGAGKNRLGASILAQVLQQTGTAVADLDQPQSLLNLHQCLSCLRQQRLLLAYHDRSDGGLFATLCEMAFAGHCGLKLRLDSLDDDPFAVLFNEEPGVVFQIPTSSEAQAAELFRQYGLHQWTHKIGTPQSALRLDIDRCGRRIFSSTLSQLWQHWSHVSYALSRLRDDADSADQCYSHRCSAANKGIQPQLTFAVGDTAALISAGTRPRVAILREQGINGHHEMAAAFSRAGFTAVDIHMTDLLSKPNSLHDCVGMAVCGGFSHGDVLGAGTGWAKTVLMNRSLRDQFRTFFHRPETFTLGVCNGCQMLAALKEIIPGADHWPHFTTNRSRQFEARLVTVEIVPSAAVLLAGMEGSRLPVPIAHGEGRTCFDNLHTLKQAIANHCVAMRYVDNDGNVSESYPLNPNGSTHGITALTNGDGRVLICMPHPERVFRAVQFSWRPRHWSESPWMRLFQNARAFASH